MGPEGWPSSLFASVELSPDFRAWRGGLTNVKRSRRSRYREASRISQMAEVGECLSASTSAPPSRL